MHIRHLQRAIFSASSVLLCRPIKITNAFMHYAQSFWKVLFSRGSLFYYIILCKYEKQCGVVMQLEHLSFYPSCAIEWIGLLSGARCTTTLLRHGAVVYQPRSHLARRRSWRRGAFVRQFTDGTRPPPSCLLRGVCTRMFGGGGDIPAIIISRIQSCESISKVFISCLSIYV